MLNKYSLWPLCFITCFIIAGFNRVPEKANSSVLHIVIKPVFNRQPLVLEKQIYHTAHGDSLYVDACRLYISALSLTGKGKAAFQETNSYHLIDAADAVSLSMYIKELPCGNYDQLHFHIGIDSLANVSGALSGDLDPAKGMYWAWHSGYINAKLEGRSNSCQTLHHAFEFHVGGYATPYNALRAISLPFARLNTTGDTTTITLEMNVADWLRGIDLKTVNSVVMPSKEAMRLADNYAGMFTIVP